MHAPNRAAPQVLVTVAETEEALLDMLESLWADSTVPGADRAIDRRLFLRGTIPLPGSWLHACWLASGLMLYMLGLCAVALPRYPRPPAVCAPQGSACVEITANAPPPPHSVAQAQLF